MVRKKVKQREAAAKSKTVKKRVTTADLSKALKVKPLRAGSPASKLVDPADGLPQTPILSSRAMGIDVNDYQMLPQAVPDNLSPEQRAIKEAGKLADDLLKREEWSHVFQAMKTLRQGYAVVYRCLQDLCAKLHEDFEKRGVEMPLVEDFLIQYAMYESSKPFTEHQWMDNVINSFLPWLATVLDEHTAADEKEAQDQRIKENEERQTRPVPIGFKHTPELEAAMLERDRSLVLVGWKPAILWLLDQVCSHALLSKDEQVYQVVRFMDSAPKGKDQHSRLIRLGGNAWRGCADSDKKLAMCMGSYVADRISAQPDLFIVDHLPSAYTAGFVGRPEAARAGDAHRRFHKWCEKAACAFLGCVCVPERGTPDITDPAFEQLRTFATLRPVIVQDEAEDLEPNKYRIIIGHAATVLDVEKDVIESYGRTILLPAGRSTIEG